MGKQASPDRMATARYLSGVHRTLFRNRSVHQWLVVTFSVALLFIMPVAGGRRLGIVADLVLLAGSFLYLRTLHRRSFVNKRFAELCERYLLHSADGEGGDEGERRPDAQSYFADSEPVDWIELATFWSMGGTLTHQKTRASSHWIRLFLYQYLLILIPGLWVMLSLLV